MKYLIKMKSPFPNKKEITELVKYLPRLYKDGFIPIRKWGGGDINEGVMPWPDYEDAVEEFIRDASKECWRDYQYISTEASKIIESPMAIESASIEEIKTMLTFCIRGERFCDGHVGSMIESGKIKSILKRLEVISNEEV